MAKPGSVFCVEGQWGDDLAERGSVLPTLELLERLGRIRFIRRDVATPGELRFYLEQWLSRKYTAYDVGIFAIDGGPGRLRLSGRHELDLSEVVGWLQGRCEGKRLYFDCGSVLRLSEPTLVEILEETGASMVCGFTKTIDWIESSAFDTVLVDRLANGRKANSVEQLVRSARWAPLAQHLGFRMVYQHSQGPRIPAMRRPESDVPV
ncbi:hypothetical protein D7147_25560 [Micromonospora musae]|uniref:Class I SAM-dependent methyltransferase n=1 Tax=Micromonospora musae TaxID=1894970 RepID=A0ABX9QZB2_9ACTN|nr:hypothetical protein [Micromonospora musae]RKN15237.1 hypothetical protein D7147_25560 [Micromonospora musae]